MTVEPAAVPTGNTYDKYGSTNPLTRRLLDGFFAALGDAVGNDPVADILEIGAGEGHVSGWLRERFPSARLVALDLADPELAQRWRAASLDGVFGDGEHLPFPDDRFDLVVAIEMLEHVNDPPAVLRELVRVGRRSLVCSVPREPLWRVLNMARGAYIREWGNTPGHIQHWSSRGFARMVGEHITVETVRRPLPWTVVSGRIS